MSQHTTHPETDLDVDAVQEFAVRVLGMLTGGSTVAMMVLGDRLGLYRALAAGGSLGAADLAAATGTNERLVLEWLSQQAAVGIVEHDPSTGAFSLPAERAAVLATDHSPASLVGAAPMVCGMYRRVDEIAEAFRTGRGLAWGAQDPTVFEATERFFGAAYRTFLLPEWVPALGLEDRLTAGAHVADVGCGRGLPLVLLAEAFPGSRFVGYDSHELSVDLARRRVADAGLEGRVRFEVADSTGYPAEGYDVITFFDSFHDLGDPRGAAEHARRALAPGGTLALVEPRAADDLATTIATMPAAGFAFASSTAFCTPGSQSQPVGAGLGAQAGEGRLRSVLEDAGFPTVRRVAETPFHLVLEARP
ncbi:MAG: class I SAM-dependent methyltransferase [Micrococcales bacterium]|nr:class I SAM-dependent methyltransferase [Micrococcales bacterium]